jgi:hypothetical protein
MDTFVSKGNHEILSSYTAPLTMDDIQKKLAAAEEWIRDLEAQHHTLNQNYDNLKKKYAILHDWMSVKGYLAQMEAEALYKIREAFWSS